MEWVDKSKNRIQMHAYIEGLSRWIWNRVGTMEYIQKHACELWLAYVVT